MPFLLAQFGGSRICARADRVEPRWCPRRSVGTERNAGLFAQNRDQPIQIEAASLEMRDKKKEATFSGNVKVVQGDTTMTSKTLVVFAGKDCGSGAGGAKPGIPSLIPGKK